MIIDDVKKDAGDFGKWATKGNYDRDRFEVEMIEYIDDMVLTGKFERGPDYGWDVGDVYYVVFIATDQPHTLERVVFPMNISDDGSTSMNTNDAYDRAMRGI